MKIISILPLSLLRIVCNGPDDAFVTCLLRFCFHRSSGAYSFGEEPAMLAAVIISERGNILCVRAYLTCSSNLWQADFLSELVGN
jgi:hypothetical protein